MEVWADGRMSDPDPGCRICKLPLTDENWSKTLQRYKRYICTVCWRAKQSNKCPSCFNILKTENIRGRGYNSTHIDHCHKTGKMRGLLCSKCNKMIGLAQESIFILENAITYIKENIETTIN